MNMSVTTDGVSMTIKTGSKDIAADVIAQLRTFEVSWYPMCQPSRGG
ncbi:MAG: hypothetical protein ACLRI8_07895 [Agathobacter rectalis]